MKNRERIEEAKKRLPLPELLRALGYQPPAGGSGNMPSPLRSGEHQSSPSFSIFERTGSWGWVDRSGGNEDKGDEITLLEKLENLSTKDAIVRYLALAGVENRSPARLESKSLQAEIPSWETCKNAFTPDAQRKLASWRGYSPELVAWLHEKGLLGSFKGSPCLPVRDASGNLLAVHVRPDNGRWFYAPKGAGSHALVLGDLESAEITAVFESQWDLFAALEAMKYHLNPSPSIAFLCTRGASNGRLAAQTRGWVYAFPQNDPEKNGKRAGEEWLKAVVAGAPGEVHRVNIPESFPDLNDWLRSGDIAAALQAAMESAVLVPRQYVSKLEAESVAANRDPEAPFDPLAICEKIGLWWLDGSGSFFLQSGEGKSLRFREMQSAMISRHLKSLCLKSRPDKDSSDPLARSMSEIDQVLDFSVKHRAVDVAASVAGTRAGVYDLPGGRLLVRQSPELIDPVEGECPAIEQLLIGLLGRDGALHLCYWLKVAFEALRAGELRPGQCLILCGPPGCGKSFIQHQVITPILAGRAADPKSYFFGRTDFNSELAGAEHLLIEEVPSSNRHEDRLTFGERIKEVVANDLMRLHKKNRDAVSVHPFHRISITINDHPEKMKVLPPLTEDFSEKLIMLHAKESPEFWSRFDGEHDPRRAVREAIRAEIPAFCHYLLDLEIPEAMRSGNDGRRYGVKSHVPEELASLLFEQEPESHLLLLIDKELFGPQSNLDPGEWRGTAEDLKQYLTNDVRSSKQSASRLLGAYPTACGQYLARLKDRYPLRFRKSRKATSRDWIISPPA